ncbi:MAG: KTSC domain-containing protein [Armatimonadetes bacterium]|nr:KTSC domain-containing protein [Armatimonadota bacterium]
MNTLTDTDSVAVDSTMLQAVAYHAETQVLTLTFHDGAVYEYDDVPQSVYDELLNAESKGQYAHSRIIDCYPYRKVRRR